MLQGGRDINFHDVSFDELEDEENTTEREKSIFDKSCEIHDDTPKKIRNRLNLKYKGSDKDDDSDVGDPLSKLVGILSEDG